jgi:hypothetical protein
VTVRFLEKLFPGARFVILRRDIREIAVSALRWFWDDREAMPPAMAEAIVRDVTYAVHGSSQRRPVLASPGSREWPHAIQAPAQSLVPAPAPTGRIGSGPAGSRKDLGRADVVGRPW